MTAAPPEAWPRRGLVALVVLVVAAPVFGWAAGAVGYAEPLEHAAEATGATDAATTTVPGLFPDYTVPGLGTPAGTLVSAAVGTALTLALSVGAGRLLER